MSYIYKFTVNYYAHSPKSTRTPITDVFYEVYSPKRLSKKMLAERRHALQKRSRRWTVRGRLKKRGFKAVHERTSMEKPVATKSRKRVIKANTIRYDRKTEQTKTLQLRTTTWGKKRKVVRRSKP